MGYPEWFKPPAPPGGRVHTAGYDTSALDVYRALTAFMERWIPKFRDAEAALEAAPQGPQRDAANEVLTDLAAALDSFRPEAELLAGLDAFYAALAS